MDEVSIEKLNGNDSKQIELIAEWYLNEWNIPKESTIQRLTNHPENGIPFQMVLKLGGIPIATGGIYNHVGLLDVEPRFKIFNPWLALVYTIPEMRNNGYGALLCNEIEKVSKQCGLDEIYLFTHTAESLYLSMNWKTIERIEIKGHDIAVMEKKI